MFPLHKQFSPPAKALTPPPSARTASTPAELKEPVQRAVDRLNARLGSVWAEPYHDGHLRRLHGDGQQGLTSRKYGGKARAHITALLRESDIRTALQLRNVELRFDGEEDLGPLGTMVRYRQVLTVKGERKAYPVRGGYLQVHMDKSGRVYLITATVRRGARPRNLSKVIAPKEAIANACTEHGDEGCLATVRLVFSSHEDKLDPAYEVELHSTEPVTRMEYLVHGITGKVVHKANKLHYGQAKGRVFFRIPSPKVKIDKQVFETMLKEMPDPTVLANEFVTIYLGSGKDLVKCKADGTFNYTPKDLEFGCVVTFYALTRQFQTYLKTGGTKPEKPIPVYVFDPNVEDNAYFDPGDPQEHLGRGSGTRNGGLNEHIEYDLGVGWHETGHYFVFLLTPAQDLPGDEGGAIHESSGDIWDLAMDWLFRIWHAKELGQPLTKKDIIDDRCVIGLYALPPDGIRIQKNNKRYPDDIRGEVHWDGLISGGASRDVLVGMATAAEVEPEQGILNFLTVYNNALKLMPSHRVLFTDLLGTMISADGVINGGKNKQLFVKCFADHGVKLATSRKKRERRRCQCPERTR